MDPAIRETVLFKLLFNTCMNPTGALTGLPDALRAGDVIAAAPVGRGVWSVRTIPEVSGGLVAQDPRSGRVLAMQGGFDSGLGSFNRATQAKRQPGSTIKPFVYAAGLEHGLTPASMVLDGTFCVYQGAKFGQKCFRNFGGTGGSGNHTMRWGLEQSRNLMTVRIANDTGMDKVVRTIKAVGIGEYEPYLSMALGAGDTTVMKMVNAYAALANQGRQHNPSLIDYVQDFTQLGDYLNMPVRTYSNGMRARLAFGLSMGISFDWYLVDEITSVGDAAFRKKSSAVFRTRLARTGLIMVSHSVSTLQEYCTSAIVLDRGHATYHPDLAEALDAHERNMATEA